MLSVLVAHSYFLRFDQKQWARAKPYPPLATLQVASTLRAAGHAVSMFDAMLAEDTDAYNCQLHGDTPRLAIFYEDNFNFLSKMCLGKMRRAAAEMIGRARRAGARVIAAGPDASDAPDAYLAAGAEVVLIGEGLSSLYKLVGRLDADSHIALTCLVAGIGGIASAVTAAASAPAAPEIVSDSQPPVHLAWDLLDIERYRAIWLNAHGFFSLNMAASRGCSFRCSWCAKPIWGNHYLQRDPGDVAREMTHLKRTIGPDHVWFADDIFGFRVPWVEKFAAAAAAEDGAIPFTIQTRADLVSTAMARALKVASCREVWLGAESGSQRVLDAMNKGTTVQEISLARARLGAEGIRVGFFIQLGYLGEQFEDILATRDLIETAHPDDIGVSVAYPLPGTRFYELVKNQLRAKTHWQESDDLEMMFDGTYSTDLYRIARNLLHQQVSIHNMSGAKDGEAYQSARRSLGRQWDLLLADEGRFRNVPRGANPSDGTAVANEA